MMVIDYLRRYKKWLFSSFPFETKIRRELALNIGITAIIVGLCVLIWYEFFQKTLPGYYFGFALFIWAIFFNLKKKS